MSWFVILIFVLAFCAVVGPVLMLKPSKGQQRIARLRQEAIENDLKVQIVQLNKEATPFYLMEWPQQNGFHYGQSPWRLERKGYTHGIHLAGYWYWSDEARPSDAVVSLLEEVLPSLPASVKGVSADRRGLGCYWSETGPLQGVQDWLRQVQAKLWPLVRVEDEAFDVGAADQADDEDRGQAP